MKSPHLPVRIIAGSVNYKSLLVSFTEALYDGGKALEMEGQSGVKEKVQEVIEGNAIKYHALKLIVAEESSDLERIWSRSSFKTEYQTAD